jgi:hypothetical protein
MCYFNHFEEGLVKDKGSGIAVSCPNRDKDRQAHVSESNVSASSWVVRPSVTMV